MKALVMSDSHGSVDSIRYLCGEAWKRTGPVDAYFHLGDGAGDFRALEAFFHAHDPEAVLENVRGNCDFYAPNVPDQKTVRFGGTSILLTHGHHLCVKQGLYLLDDEAVRQECSIALYGHTHEPAMDMYSVLMINPGSVQDGRIAFLEVTEGRPRVELWHFQ